MNKEIESLLISGIFEEKSQIEFGLNSIGNLTNLLCEHFTEFVDIPESIYVSNSDFHQAEKEAQSHVGLAKDLVTNFGKNNNSEVNFLEKKGVLLFDGMHASAFGRMSYIYRSKGTRIYFQEDGVYKVVTPYCTIDHDGFQLKQEEVFSFEANSIKSISDLDDLFFCVKTDFNNPGETISYSRNIIKMICNIKRDFSRDFYLEYLITPPDVDELSDFSQQVRKLLWEICLSRNFQFKWGEQVQFASMNLLSLLDIPPSSNQLINHIKSISTQLDSKEILERLEVLESNIVSKLDVKDDIIEFKPNFAGMGLNGNEVFKRIKSMWSINED